MPRSPLELDLALTGGLLSPHRPRRQRQRLSARIHISRPAWTDVGSYLPSGLSLSTLTPAQFPALFCSVLFLTPQRKLAVSTRSVEPHSRLFSNTPVVGIHIRSPTFEWCTPAACTPAPLPPAYTRTR
ncbi:hypothetical protein EVG20_g6329 [Dentipellis fragilis]|uniref:Uncharacterized protein n=1 Tax=Dentipellis fragilis TaxID=205917 RepID=A0A4Y9YNV5_9AGAM|nr:hypothetical protein EVG20_g6329 [Dentipellis fragilis]